MGSRACCDWADRDFPRHLENAAAASTQNREYDAIDSLRAPFIPESSQKIAIFTLDLNSKQVKTIPGSEGLYSPRLSPDGKRLAALSADSQKLMLYDFFTHRWSDWLNEPGAIMFPTWSKDGKFMYYSNHSSQNAGYRRVKIGERHSELVVDLRDLPQFDLAWSSLSPNGDPLFVRDLSSDEIYALDVDLP